MAAKGRMSPAYMDGGRKPLASADVGQPSRNDENEHSTAHVRLSTKLRQGLSPNAIVRKALGKHCATKDDEGNEFMMTRMIKESK